jgi:hypothetical protein
MDGYLSFSSEYRDLRGQPEPISWRYLLFPPNWSLSAERVQMPPGWLNMQRDLYDMNGGWHRAGILVMWNTHMIGASPFITDTRIRIAHAWLLFGAMLFPLIRGMVRVVKSVRQTHSIEAGRCRICGYDLHATPDRRPECGTVPPAIRPTPLAPTA